MCSKFCLPTNTKEQKFFFIAGMDSQQHMSCIRAARAIERVATRRELLLVQHPHVSCGQLLVCVCVRARGGRGERKTFFYIFLSFFLLCLLLFVYINTLVICVYVFSDISGMDLGLDMS